MDDVEDGGVKLLQSERHEESKVQFTSRLASSVISNLQTGSPNEALLNATMSAKPSGSSARSNRSNMGSKDLNLSFNSSFYNRSGGSQGSFLKNEL